MEKREPLYTVGGNTTLWKTVEVPQGVKNRAITWSIFLPAGAQWLSRVWLCVTPRTVTYQAPLSMGLSRQEYWNGLPFPTSGYISKEKDIIISKKRSEVKSLSRIQLFVTPWTVAYNAPPFIGLSRQECWSGLPFPSPEDLPNPGIEPGSPTL